MKIVVTGATGMVGAEVIRQAIADPYVIEIVALVRKPLEIQHPKVKTILQKDFLDYSATASKLKDCEACIWCLGISQLQVSRQEYEVITYEYTMAAANAMLTANPSIRFAFVSGDGADTTEKSRTLFARIKGKTENALKQLPFTQLIIARPGGIRPIHKNRNTAFLNKLVIPLYPILEIFIPSKVINSVQLAKALLYKVKSGSGISILENAELKHIAAALDDHKVIV